MKYSEFELVDELLCKAAHVRCMKDVNTSLQRGVFLFNCKNILKSFIRNTSERGLIVNDYSQCLENIIDTLSNLDKFEMEHTIGTSEHVRLIVPFILPYRVDCCEDRVCGQTSPINLHLISYENRLTLVRIEFA
jgi:hypothetical protein